MYYLMYSGYFFFFCLLSFMDLLFFIGLLGVCLVVYLGMGKLFFDDCIINLIKFLIGEIS